MKPVGRNLTPGSPKPSRRRASSNESTYGAPKISKGRVVPRPSDTCVPSRCTEPGKTVADSGVGMLGEGKTQCASVSSNQSSRDQPSRVTTSSSQPIPQCSLNILQSSPIVIPCLVGTGNCPTKDANPRSRTLPSQATPPTW